MRRDTGVSPSDAGTEDAFGDASRDAFVVPVDANFPHDSGPSDANMMTDAVGGGAGLMCTACMTDADCRAGSFCVQLASTGERVCLQSCNAEIPSCPHRFDCLNSILTPTAGPVCTPVGARCCIDADEDDHGFGVGCRGTDCDETNPHVYQGAPEVCNGFDDNCDGTPDDGNPGGGNLCMGSAPGVCSAGMTMCMAGSVSCVPNTSVGSMTESCNGLDDDCDGPIDEGFAFMGDPLFPGMSFPLQGACSVGLGACRRAGAVVCASGGASAICNVMAGTGTTEICNYIDDDCDGTVDDGFVSASGIYQADTDCGACGIDCTMIYAHPGTFGTCSLSGTRATCVMNCNAGSFNLNGIPDDGCEFMLDSSAIYVSGEDAAAIDDAGCGLGPSASGAGNHPCRTIAYGQGRATTTGRTRILVADALYNESITLVNGQSLMGGYRADTWERHLTTTLTTLRGTSGSGHRRTITAMNITSGLVEGFVIDGAAASTPGANSYAIYVSGGTSGLVIRNNVVYAGDGAPGSPGAAGVDGARGVPGTAGLMAFDTGVVVCSVTSAGGAGGVLSCGGTSVSGGAGGGAVCAPIADTTPPYTAFSARAGAAGSGTGGGAGGAAALDGATHSVGSTGNDQCGLCYLPLGGNTMTGSDGAAGAVGMNGGAGAGSASATGGIAGTDWVGAAGGPGSSGANGGGGGGGGAGGGDDGDGGAYTCTDDLGATGGGGGSGGCAGSAGIGGTAGGGSFGIFVVGTTNYPTLTGNTIYRGFGGAGGNGGRGGAGGVGGAGAAGGLKSNANSSFCTGDAGHGGNGGNAGHGGGGGGGAGGVSYGIYVAGTTGYGASTNTFPPSGGGGAGGGGGPSLGTSGTPGVAGASGTTD